jgi:hypothetical protein
MNLNTIISFLALLVGKANKHSRKDFVASLSNAKKIPNCKIFDG